MYQSKKPYLYGTGRRKSSVARVQVFPGGSGSITVNGRDIEEYFGLDTLKMIVRQPLVTTEQVGKVDLLASVTGGGALFYITWSGNTVHWYNHMSDSGQMNSSGTTYHVVALLAK